MIVEELHYISTLQSSFLGGLRREGCEVLSGSSLGLVIARRETAEAALRRLASYVHEERTGNRDAALSMLAIKPAHLSHDIAPAWLVSKAASFAPSEHNRRERAKAQRGDGKGSSVQAEIFSKGDGRGRDGKRPGGKVTSSATQG